MYAQIKDWKDGHTLGNYRLVHSEQDGYYWQNQLSDGILSLGGMLPNYATYRGSSY